ncbi:hypothetical protein EYZ11_009167 [Aspergillus tanneri]|uniref:Kinesin light chain n=1 Tax=Aspergillus tanneri TaxID=1220188 RepID=A0A4S3JAQ9_9EURO|nr:hypothetical protein EYZ11_009167 [Aspergillus tanneri]
MTNLASTYASQGRWKEAEELQTEVLGLSLRALGPEHPDSLTIMANLASTYWIQQRWKEAEALEIQVLEIRKRVLGPQHPDTLACMNNIAYTWKSLGKEDDAVLLMRECVHFCNRYLGPDHPHTISSTTTLQDWQRVFFGGYPFLEIRVAQASKLKSACLCKVLAPTYDPILRLFGQIGYPPSDRPETGSRHQKIFVSFWIFLLSGVCYAVWTGKQESLVTHSVYLALHSEENCHYLWALAFFVWITPKWQGPKLHAVLKQAEEQASRSTW